MGHICMAVDLDTFMYAGPRGQKAERNIKVKKRAFKVYRTIRSFTFEKSFTTTTEHLLLTSQK